MNNAQWIAEAEAQAKKYSDAIKNNSKYLTDQLNAAKTNTLEQLQKQQNNAIYNINANESNINRSAEDNAKQANINRLLALKDNQSAMNRAGLGTQGVVGSQVNDINSSYGTNLNNILLNKTNQLNDLAKQRNNTNLQYDTNRINLENEYGSNIANLQSQIDDKALNQYNTVYNNYLAYKQQQWENEQAEKAAAEKIRQFNEQMAYQKEQDAIANQLAMAKAYSSGGSRSGGSSYSFDKTTGTLNPYTGTRHKDADNGTFGNGYQPDNIRGIKLSNSGIKMKDIYADSAYGSTGIPMGYQSIWQKGNDYYVWDGSVNDYLKITDDVKKSKQKGISIIWNK